MESMGHHMLTFVRIEITMTYEGGFLFSSGESWMEDSWALLAKLACDWMRLPFAAHLRRGAPLCFQPYTLRPSCISSF